MKRSRFSEEQIIAILKEQEAGFTIQPVELLVVHHVPLAFEHDAHAAVAEPVWQPDPEPHRVLL